MTSDVNSTKRFETEIAHYQKWRDELTAAVHAYHDWLEQSGKLDVQLSIRFYDLLENLSKGRMQLAFLAEFSRGKSELINAMFFSSFKERLLPSDVGRTTMCPTEIFHDPTEEPYLKLLSVETRYRDESISQLKNMPVEWSKVRLNITDTAQMKEALSALTDTKRVYALDARMMGLIPMFDDGDGPKEDDIVEVPSWRYAMVNYPHPLLTSGLSVLDTPGLNALGLEPELTLSAVPNAQAVLFLLGIDTGVTKSDMEIWDRYVKVSLPTKIAVLNKTDLLWDGLKTDDEVAESLERMIVSTCATLKLPREKVFALSAQKALVGRISGDADVIKRSNIESLEDYIAHEIIPIKRQLLAQSVTNEIGGMMAASHQSCVKQLAVIEAQAAEMAGLAGKSRDLTTKLLHKAGEEKDAYNLALAEYKTQRALFTQKKNALLDQLNETKLDVLCARGQIAMNDSWTTVGLTRGMREVIRLINEEFNSVAVVSDELRLMMEIVYQTFHERFGFADMTLPSLDLEKSQNKLKLLIHETEAFCKDPVNIVMTEKRFLVRRFWRMLVESAKRIFNEARVETEQWLLAVPLPLETQMKDHKTALDARLTSLARINEKGSAIKYELAKFETQRADVITQIEIVHALMAKVRTADPANEYAEEFDGAKTLANGPSGAKNAEFLDTVRVAPRQM